LCKKRTEEKGESKNREIKAQKRKLKKGTERKYQKRVWGTRPLTRGVIFKGRKEPSRKKLEEKKGNTTKDPGGEGKIKKIGNRVEFHESTGFKV